MTCRWFARLIWALGLAVPLLFGSSRQAAAQEQSTQTQAEEQKPQTADEKEAAAKKAEQEGLVRLTEEVSVTGSLIPRKDIEALSPVAVVNTEEVTYEGTGRVEDLIQQLPQAFAAQNSTIANGATGTATVQLRNLGSVRTLSLINGRRMASGDTFSAAADLNFIPSTLVRRVDVLTGGASSVYGADAVTGVVNFVLDTEFEGFRGEVQYNAFQHNNNNAVAQAMNEAVGFDYPTGSTWNNGGYNFSLAVGGKLDGGKGHASAFVDYRDIGAIWKNQRDYTNCSVGRGANGPICSGSSTWQYGRWITNSGKSWVLDPNTGNTDAFRARRSTDVFNYGPFNFMQRNDRKWGGGGFARYQFSDKLEPYAEVMFMDDYSDAQIAPSADFGVTSLLNCDNPMMSEQQRNLLCTAEGYGPNDMATVLIYRRNVEGGNRTSQLRHVNWRLLSGVKGDLSPSWNYDVYGMFARVSAPNTYINDLNANRIQDALIVDGTPGDPSTWRCRSGNTGCYPWNIFTVGGVDTQATDYMSTNAVYDSGTQTKMINGQLRGDLENAGIKLPSASEGVQLVLGTEIRNESMFLHPDEVYELGLRAGSGGETPPVDGSYETNELFLEALVPLVQDTRGFQNLSLELGYRFANYKASGREAKNNNSYKLMGTWAPVEGFRLRGGFNRAVRAPNVRELFRPQGKGLGGSEDVCAGPSPSLSAAQCANTGVTAAQYGNVLPNPADQYNSLEGGNPDLDVEKANTYTIGFVWTPRSIAGLTLTADYYDIKITDTIASFNPDDTVKVCAETGNPALCSLIHRDRFGTLWATPDGYTISTNQNVGDLKARGIDVSFSYPWDLGKAGYISFSLLGSTMLENRLTTPFVDYDCAGYFGNQCGIPSPKWRHRARASWNTNFKATFTVGWRYLQKVMNDDASPNPDLGNPGLEESWKINDAWENPTFNWFDLAAVYKFRDSLRLTVGCNNIFDKEPPLGPSLNQNDYGAGWYNTYDSLGRAIYANLQFEF